MFECIKEFLKTLNLFERVVFIGLILINISFAIYNTYQKNYMFAINNLLLCISLYWSSLLLVLSIENMAKAKKTRKETMDMIDIFHSRLINFNSPDLEIQGK